MKRPKWVIVIGVLTIIIGLWGGLRELASIGSSYYYLSMDSVVETESPVSGRQNPGAKPSPPIIEDTQNDKATQERKAAQSDEDIGSFPDTFNEKAFWAIVLGTISLLVSGFYVLAGVFLMTKSHGAVTYYWAMAVSILWSVAQAVLVSEGQLQAFLLFITFKAPSIVIDAVLTTVVLIGTRYQPMGHTIITDRQLLDKAASIYSNPVYVGVPVVTGGFAALCVLVIPFWIMGVPGVANNFARGWNIGLDVIMYYPIAWIVVYGLFQLLKKYLHLTRHSSVTFGVSVCLVLFFGMAIFRLIQAFSIMAM